MWVTLDFYQQFFQNLYNWVIIIVNLYFYRDPTTVVLALTKPLGVTLSILTTRPAFMLELTLVELMEKLCQAR